LKLPGIKHFKLRYDRPLSNFAFILCHYSVGVQHAACVALDGVIRGNIEVRTHAVHAGAVEAVVAAMGAHLHGEAGEELQRVACAPLSGMTGDDVGKQTHAGNCGRGLHWSTFLVQPQHYLRNTMGGVILSVPLKSQVELKCGRM